MDKEILFKGTLIAIDIDDCDGVALTVEVVSAKISKKQKYQYSWRFPQQRALVKFSVKFGSRKIDLSGMLKPGSEVFINTRINGHICEVMSVDGVSRTAVSAEDFTNKLLSVK